jgi:hypothetical protein
MNQALYAHMNNKRKMKKKKKKSESTKAQIAMLASLILPLLRQFKKHNGNILACLT